MFRNNDFVSLEEEKTKTKKIHNGKKSNNNSKQFPGLAQVQKSKVK